MSRSKSAASATMKDVARRAGVSTATVSRAFSHPEMLSVATRNRVEEAATYSGYIPQTGSGAAEAHTVLALIADPTDPLQAQVLQGVKRAAAERGYSLLIRYDEPETAQSRLLIHTALARQVSGVIRIGTPDRSPAHEPCNFSHLPQIVVGGSVGGVNSVSVDVDRMSAAFSAVSYLCRLGYSRIACILGEWENRGCYYHQMGYEQALRRWKIADEMDYVCYGDISCRHGANAMERLMALPTPPNAVYCSHDLLAIGALHQLKQNGLDVPQSVSIIGFGNLDIGAFHTPSLTSLSYPSRQIGEQAMTTLSEWLDSPSQRPKSHLFDSQIVQRKTTIARQY